MKVLHVIPSLSVKHGGPSKALPVMAASLVAEGVQVDVVTTDDDGPGCRLDDVCAQGWIIQDGWRLRYFSKQTEFYKVSLPLLRWLMSEAGNYDVVHVHAVFSFATLAGGWTSMLRHVPFVVRPLGTLSAWGMENRRRWLKWASFRLLDRPVLNAAAAIHCTSVQEAGEVKALGLHSPVEMLPLGFDLSGLDTLPARSAMEAEWPVTSGKQVLLFLSRLDEKKGVECLIDAFAKVRRTKPDVLLVLAGSGTPEYVKALKERAASLGDAVLWTAHVEGEAKRALLGGADVFVLPSRAENFGIALLEAMAAGLACVTTPGVALVHEEDCRDAVVISPVDDANALAGHCLSLLSDATARAALAGRARVAARAFSSELMASRLKELYRRLVSFPDPATDP